MTPATTRNTEPVEEPTSTPPAGFVDRRKKSRGDAPIGERRQFANSHAELSSEARELAIAIDEYKLRNRRRFITYEEMYNVITELGYKRFS